MTIGLALMGLSALGFSATLLLLYVTLTKGTKAAHKKADKSIAKNVNSVADELIRQSDKRLQTWRDKLPEKIEPLTPNRKRILKQRRQELRAVLDMNPDDKKTRNLIEGIDDILKLEAQE